jgi:hypothetical protein
MGNQEWNSGITKEMGNQTFKESSQVLSSSLKKALSNSLYESPFKFCLQIQRGVL